MNRKDNIQFIIPAIRNHSSRMARKIILDHMHEAIFENIRRNLA